MKKLDKLPKCSGCGKNSNEGSTHSFGTKEHGTGLKAVHDKEWNDASNRLQSKLVDIVEEHFPKGNRNRGKATLMMSFFYIEAMWEMEYLLQRMESKAKEDTRSFIQKLSDRLFGRKT